MAWRWRTRTRKGATSASSTIRDLCTILQFVRSERLATAGKWCFLAGVVLMVTGDGLTNIHEPVATLAWPWLYLVPLVASMVLSGAAGRLAGQRPRASIVYTPLAVLLAAFALSTAFSQERSLSLIALGCVLGIA